MIEPRVVLDLQDAAVLVSKNSLWICRYVKKKRYRQGVFWICLGRVHIGIKW